MVKKRAKRSTSKSKTSHSSKMEVEILENLVGLQRVHVKLAEKFENLSDQISELLILFEKTAKSFAMQPHMQINEKDKEFLDKIDMLLEQNKTIAKGLTLMEEKLRDRLYGSPPPAARPRMPQKDPFNF